MTVGSCPVSYLIMHKMIVIVVFGFNISYNNELIIIDIIIKDYLSQVGPLLTSDINWIDSSFLLLVNYFKLYCVI